MNSCLHIHSENSLNQCSLSVPDILSSAAAAGYTSVALTDNGNMTGAIEFYLKAQGYGINPIIGVESYIAENGDLSQLILLAKNQEGYVQLCKLVTLANKQLSPEGIPLLSWTDIENFFLEQEQSHIFAVSPISKGFITYPFWKNEDSKRLLSDSLNDRSLSSEQMQEYQKLCNQKKEVLSSLDALKSRKKSLEKKKKTETAAGSSQELLSGIDDELRSCVTAVSRCNKTKKTIEKQISLIKKLLDQKEQDTIRYDEIRESLLSEGEMLKCTLSRIHALCSAFPASVFLELENHMSTEDSKMAEFVKKIISESGIPVTIGNDIHILTSTDKDVMKWSYVQSMQDNKWIPPASNAGEYCMKKPDALLDCVRALYGDTLTRQAELNTDMIGHTCLIELDRSEHYPKYSSDSGLSASEELEKRCRENIPKLYSNWDDTHEQILQYQLDVIDRMGYSDYTLTIADILSQARAMASPEVVSCLVGPGRGSGAGCLVNYLTGITSVEPLQYDLIFERYLNIERVSPPDIDSDIATSIREALVELIKKGYRKSEDKIGVCCISTKLRLAAKSAIRASARIISDKYHGDTTSFAGTADRMAKFLPNDPKLKLTDHASELYEKFSKPEEHEILDGALLMEGFIYAYGTHAAGVIISDSGDVTDYAPLINIGSAKNPVWNIQCDMVESESLGLLKMDMLGLLTLDINYDTLKLIYRRTGKRIDLQKIPFEKEVFREIYTKGATNCVFQCESPGMKQMWTELKPSCIEDINAGIALYRPGPMDFIPAYIHGKEHPEQITYKTPMLRPILENTYGVIVYQEQVMRIVRDLAGYSMGRSDLVRRAMSKKKDTVMQKERQNFVYGNKKEHIIGCAGNGIAPDIANQIYDDMVDFAKYAFNKSHAAAYAVVSYQTAWLKYHYPAEFMVSSMNHSTSEKLPALIRECSRLGFPVLPPDINISQAEFSITEKDGKPYIYFGLGNVKSVKKNALDIVENRKGVYTSFKDFVLRGGANKTSIKNLIKGGAFDQFGNSRTALLNIYENLMELRKKIQEKEGKYKQACIHTEQADASIAEKSLAACNAYASALETLTKEFQEYPIPEIPEKIEEKTVNEKEVLFTYIGTHPLDAYEIPSYITSISDIMIMPGETKPKCSVIGLIKNLKILNQKSNGRKMAILDLEDKTGDIHVVCYAQNYQQYEELLKENTVIQCFCNISHDQRDQESYILSINTVKAVKPSLEPIIYKVSNGIPENPYSDEILKLYLCEQGHPLVYMIGAGKNTGALLQTDYCVKKEILGLQDTGLVKILGQKK